MSFIRGSQNSSYLYKSYPATDRQTDNPLVRGYSLYYVGAYIHLSGVHTAI